MKLSDATNAHGALWNDINYSVKICYDEIFGANGNGDRTCHGNKVLGLSNITNAHAETPDKTAYTTNVCYGDLACRAVNISKGESCEAVNGEKETASLWSYNNSHLAVSSDTNYSIKICCKSGAPALSGAYWADMNEKPISVTYLDNTVKLVASGSDMAGKVLNFSIYQKPAGAGEAVWSWFFGNKKVAQLSSKESVTWKANPAGDYYFEVFSQTEPSNIRRSGNLTVFPYINSTPPIANIIFPINKQIYFLNENLNFSQNSYDADDEFTYVWNLGDGTIKRGDSISLDNYNFSHAYSASGQKNIILNVTDERGKSAIARASILIVNSTKESLAYIDSPAWESNFGKSVNYDASSSYGVNVTINSIGGYEIACLAGMCPSQTEGCPPSKGTGCHIPVSNSPQAYTRLTFFWEFIDKNNEKTFAGNPGPFTEIYPRSGRHTTKLTVTLN